MSDAAHVRRFRELMLAAVAEIGPSAAVMLSGGVDSATILAAALELGGRPDCYGFHVGGHVSWYARVPAAMCRQFGLKFSLSVIPRDDETLQRDVRRTIRIVRTSRKTHVQCSQPFLYLAAEAARDGHRSASFGMAAGDLWGDSRRAQQGQRERGDEWFNEKRRTAIDDPTESDWSCVKTAAHFGVQLRDPWRSPAFVDFMLSLRYSEMHRPIRKHLAVAAFPDFWRAGRWYRDHENLQICSGLREWHDTLLAGPLNRRGSLRVVAVYNDVLAEIEAERA